MTANRPQNTSERAPDTTSLEFQSTDYLRGQIEAAAVIERGTPDTFGATPLSLDDPQTSQQQIKLFLRLQQEMKDSAPEGMPEAITTARLALFAEGFHERSNANYKNFRDALVPKSSFIPGTPEHDLIELAEPGHANPAENILVGEMMQMSSIELGCVTGDKPEQYEAMLAAVESSVVLLGGEYFEDPFTTYRVKGLTDESRENATFENGIHMMRKRLIGRMSDGTDIKEKTFFTIPTDPDSFVRSSGLLSDYNIAMMKTVKSYKKGWGDAVARLGGLDTVADTLLESGMSDKVLMSSSTVFAANEERRQLVSLRFEKQLQQSRERNARLAPALYEAQERLWGHTWTGSIQQIKPADSDR